MKIAYEHLVKSIPSNPSIDDISDKLFQLGHEHEIENKIFDMELTPNRGDCLSVNGILRDLAVFYEINKTRHIYTNQIKPFNIDFKNKVPEACSIMTFLKITINESTKPYKGVLADYFVNLQNTKNNFFTDISNYIAYETGQPTHCYDADKIQNTITLDFNNNDEFETLTNKKIKLKDKNLVFTHDNKIINLAGIMGGKSTSCTANTRSVIVECAHFNQEYILGQAKKYDLNSEAAHKFERGVDPICHENVLRRFIKIVEDHADIANIELFKKEYKEFNPVKIKYSKENIQKILGIDICKEDLFIYLSRLGFIIDDNTITVPSYRNDIYNENDIAEEVARTIGYNNIPKKDFYISLKHETEEVDLLEGSLKNLLINNGFFEVINYPFEKFVSHDLFKVDNPLDSSKGYLRGSLKESLINNLLYNERRQQDSIKLFEISNIYHSKDLVESKRILGIICSGRVDKNYIDFSKKIDKKYLANILKGLSKDINFDIESINRNEIGSKGSNPIIYFEINLDKLNNFKLSDINKKSKKLDKDTFIKYAQISEYPLSSRDLSFSVKDLNDFHELQKTLLNFKNDLIKEIFIFDFFQNKKNNEVKIGFRFIFQSKVTTITESDVNKIMDNIIEIATSIKSVSIPGLK